MQDFVGKDEATLYIGIRADEDRVGARGGGNIAVNYPLRELGMGLTHVYAVVQKFDLCPQHSSGSVFTKLSKPALGNLPLSRMSCPQWVFDRTFAWRSRPNCFMCFYQRRYEWLGLLEHHPELFSRAEKMETEIGNREKIFTWNDGMSLSEIRRLANDLFQKRVNAVTKMLSKRLQKDLWTDALIDDMEMANKSCGIFCGK